MASNQIKNIFLKDTIKKIKIKAIFKRKYLQYTQLTKDLYPEYINNSYNSIIKDQVSQFKMGQQFEHMLHKEIYKCPISA